MLTELNETLANHLKEARYAREEYHIDSRQEDVTHLSFDYAQNLWLPHLPNQPASFYFMSLLNVCIFGLLDEKKNIKMNYIYDESQGKKGSNNVVSMIVHYYYKLRPEKRKQIIFHCDNCTGQNKNNCMIKTLCWFVMQGHSDDIQLTFMVRGHTKFGLDGHFGVIKKTFQTRDCFTMDHIHTSINESSSSNQSFIFPSTKFKDYRTPLDDMFNDVKGISKYQCFWFNKDWKGKVKVRKSVDDDFVLIDLLKIPLSSYAFNPEQLPIPGIKMIKQEGLYTKVRPFIPDAYKDVLYPRPTNNTIVTQIKSEEELVIDTEPKNVEYLMLRKSKS
eukprot:NODE_542_length_6882_cov_0.127967.p1 type:complete len:332 gc:universal NODE_542_length_6882_cov_0.127967:2098-1103(-)